MPDHSAWGADPDDLTDDPSLHFDPEDVADPDPDDGPVPHLPGTEVAVSEASSSVNDSDWLGDDDYDHDGELIRPRRQGQPSRLLNPARNPRLARAYERRRKVVQMRINGHSFPEIARVLKFNSVDGCRDAFKRAMLDTRDVAEEYRDLELQRLEEMTQILWPLIQSGDLEAIDKYIKVAGLRIKITRMDQMTLTGHGAVGEGEENVERIGMVEDVQQFLAMLPDLMRMTNQPQAMVVDGQGVFVVQEKADDGKVE